MKLTPLFVISSLFVTVTILLALGCSQQKVQTEVPPPPTPPTETAIVQPVDKTGRDSSSQSQIKTQPIIASDIGESSPQVESLDTAAPPAKNGVFDQIVPVSEGRTSSSMLPIYFDFDRSNIRDDQLARIQGNAAIMKQQLALRVRIEGNCDERGTNEYNMALGERRAMSTKKFMIDMGVDETRLETLSYGEERPFNPGHDEASWALNRRGDFVIIK